MLTVLSWCGQLWTNEEAYLGVDQPIRDRHVKISGFGRSASAKSLMPYGILYHLR